MGAQIVGKKGGATCRLTIPQTIQTQRIAIIIVCAAAIYVFVADLWACLDYFYERHGVPMTQAEIFFEPCYDFAGFCVGSKSFTLCKCDELVRRLACVGFYII